MNKFNHSYTKLIGNRKLHFKDVVLVPRKSNVSHVDLRVNYDFGNNNNTPKKGWSGIPLFVHGNLSEINKDQEFITILPRSVNNSVISHEYFKDTEKYALTCGLNDYHLALELIRKLKNESGIIIKFLYINIPNGYLYEMQDITLTIKYTYPELTIIAGNVLTPDITYDLIKYSGVDIVKCGLIKGMNGYPMFSAVLECSSAAHDAGGFLAYKDKDMNNIPKAFGAGVDFVEIGANSILVPTIKSLKDSLRNNNSETLNDFFFNSKFLKLL